jgi:hypothetical protein
LNTDRPAFVSSETRSKSSRFVSPPDPFLSKMMPYAIIRGTNGQRHEVDFGDAPVRVEIYSSEETVEILIEADLLGSSTYHESRLRGPASLHIDEASGTE